MQMTTKASGGDIGARCHRFPHTNQERTLATSTATAVTTSPSATLASLLTTALKDVEKLTLEKETLTKCATYAESLLQSLAVEVPPPTNTITSPPYFFTPVALNAFISAEARATAAEARLSTFYDSWLGLLQLDDHAAEERRRFESTVTEERRRLLFSVENQTATPPLVAYNHKPPPTYPFSFHTEPAPSAHSSLLSSVLPPLPSFKLLPPPSSYTQRYRNFIKTSTLASSLQPPTKRIRVGDTNSSQIQQVPNPNLQQLDHTNPLRFLPCSYQQTTSQTAFHSQGAYHSPSNIGGTGRGRLKQQECIQNGHVDNDDDVEMGMLEENKCGFSDASAVSHSGEGGDCDRHKDTRSHPRYHSSIHDKDHRDCEIQELHDKSGVITDEAALHIHSLYRNDEVEQDPPSSGLLPGKVDAEEEGGLNCVSVDDLLWEMIDEAGGVNPGGAVGSSQGRGGTTEQPSVKESSGLTPSMGPLSAQCLFEMVGLPPGGYPAMNGRGERTCQQCGQSGRFKDGRCVEKWGPGPAGPGTVCDKCRKKVRRIERRGGEGAYMLAQAQAQVQAPRDGMVSTQNNPGNVAGYGRGGKRNKGSSNNDTRSITRSLSPRGSSAPAFNCH